MGHDNSIGWLIKTHSFEPGIILPELYVLRSLVLPIHTINDIGAQNYRQMKRKNKWNTPTGASTNPKNFDLNKNLNMNLILIETWNLNLKLKHETETWNWNLKLKLDTKTWNWNLMLNFEIETWNWNLTLKLEIKTWNWNMKL